MTVKLNVGGTKYETTKETLQMHGPHMLSSLIEHEHRDYNKEYIFIDRNGCLFSYILDYLRSGIVPHENQELLYKICYESDFYGIESLTTKIKRKIQSIQTLEDKMATIIRILDQISRRGT